MRKGKHHRLMIAAFKGAAIVSVGVGYLCMAAIFGCTSVQVRKGDTYVRYDTFLRKTELRGLRYTADSVELDRASGDASEAVGKAADALKAIAEAAK
jgi:hypothetical protein